MERKEYREFANVVAAFNFRDLQTFVTIGLVLEAQGRTIEELIDYVQTKQARDLYHHNTLAARAMSEGPCQESKATRPCPKCETHMMLFSVNTNRCGSDRVKGGFTRQWICPNEECNEEEFE